MCLGSVQKKLFFSFSYVEYFVHKGNNHIPKRERLACLAFVVVLPCYLLHTEICVVGKILKIHTHSIYGAMHRWELAVQRGGDTGLQQQLPPALGALTPVLKQSLSMTK